MEYTSVKVPKAMAKRITREALSEENGYRSVSEFVLESIRLRLENIEKAEPTA